MSKGYHVDPEARQRKVDQDRKQAQNEEKRVESVIDKVRHMGKRMMQLWQQQMKLMTSHQTYEEDPEGRGSTA